MISFKAFIEGINNAVLAANDSLMDKNAGLFDTYFEKAPASSGVSTAGNINKSVDTGSTLQAKSITIQYPHQNPDGTTTMVNVDVPLITLIPVSFSQIEEMKLKAHFDLQVINNELQISFSSESPKRRKWFTFGKPEVDEEEISSGLLEITLKPTEGPEGLKRIIEGYEKVLRAQIPH